MPGPYTSAQKQSISDFTQFTSGDKNMAAKMLKQHGWNVQAAVNAYFNNPQSNGPSPCREAATKIFDKYRDDPKNEPDAIDIEGAGNMLGEMDIGLDDVGALVFHELVQAPSLGRIERQGFVDGVADVNADSLTKIRNVILQRRSQLSSDATLFKNVYNHTFSLALSGNQKILPLEVAREFWQLLLSSPSWDWRTDKNPWLQHWFDFLESKGQKAVNKDLWKMTPTFARETMKNDDVSFWSEESSWPSTLDDFVEWLKKEKGIGGGGGGDSEQMQME
ncbi:DUF298-domain-containing protein [Polychaeton citri CBS 116435]|uniref:Defective in cullin neddylation protein n=1 Tax=Polychaeton citri CBS 116435 TaxID=1314669 RepID=A0A9P4QCE3_9PEZI|nr:DUF298-domain-containing protein [Polychaeton citri CBS 116435]